LSFDVFSIATRALRLLPAETAHRTTIRLAFLAAPFLPHAKPDDPRLAVEAFGLKFANPVGLAAGFDKDAEVPHAMAKFGFGFVECGTVTPRPQAGNPKPRLFRLVEDRAVINRMGFNNRGMEIARGRLSARDANAIVGINIGANKDSTDRIVDYRACFDVLAPLARYVTINVSSPNTPALRGLQNRDELSRLLSVLVEARTRSGLAVPLLLKIAPDLNDAALDDVAATVMSAGIEGLIVSNTTIGRPSSLRSANATEAGGLSGAPLLAPSTRILAEMRKRVGARVVLVGVGGIANGRDAYAKIRSGASLVQLYTALAYDGPGLVSRIKRELLECLSRDGFARVTDAIGVDV
jgi:dihydroorotate dehydrogenase